MATLRGSSGKCQGREFIRGGTRRTWHFHCIFLLYMALVTCPCACRLRRLAQKRVSRPGRSAVSLYISALNGSCDMSMCISTAQTRATRLSRHFSCKFLHKMGLVTCHAHFDCVGSPKTGVAVLGRGITLFRRACEGILPRRLLIEILYRELL